MAADPDWRVVVARVRDAIDDAYPAGGKRPTLVDELAGHVERATKAWPLLVDYGSGEVDRRGDLLSGPLYTSGRYPWPRDGGRWREPVLQLDLERWGARGGRDVGRGLLQLWEPRTSGLIRVIPPEALADPPSLIPSERGGDYSSVFGHNDPETGRPEWLDRPGRITGFGSPFFDAAPWHLFRNIRIIADPEYNDDAVEPAALIERLRAVLDDIGEPEYDARHRAFGMCGGNVFVTAEDLYLPPVLLTIEHDERVYSMMGSTLCVCVSEIEGSFTYSAYLFWK